MVLSLFRYAYFYGGGGGFFVSPPRPARLYSAGHRVVAEGCHRGGHREPKQTLAAAANIAARTTSGTSAGCERMRADPALRLTPSSALTAAVAAAVTAVGARERGREEGPARYVGINGHPSPAAHHRPPGR